MAKCVGLIQQSHALEIYFALFHYDGQQLGQAEIVHTDGDQRLVKETVNFLVVIAQNGCMVGISSHAPDAE